MARTEPKKKTEKIAFLLRALNNNLDGGDLVLAINTLRNISNEAKILLKDLQSEREREMNL